MANVCPTCDGAIPEGQACPKCSGGDSFSDQGPLTALSREDLLAGDTGVEHDPEMEKILKEYGNAGKAGPSAARGTGLPEPPSVTHTAEPSQRTMRAVRPRHLGAGTLSGGTPKKVMLGLLAATSLCAIISTSLLLWPQGDDGPRLGVWFMRGPYRLASRPSNDAASEHGGDVMRGARVIRVHDDGPFALIQDLRGRAGYVPGDLLAEKRPAFAPETFDFPDCQPGFLDEGAEACTQRAQQQRDACTEQCPSAVADLCGGLCAERAAACVSECEAPVENKFREDACAECPGRSVVRQHPATVTPTPKAARKKNRGKKKRGGRSRR